MRCRARYVALGMDAFASVVQARHVWSLSVTKGCFYFYFSLWAGIALNRAHWMPSSKAADSELTWLGFRVRVFFLTSSADRLGCQMQRPRSDSAGGAGKGREPRSVAANVTQHVMALDSGCGQSQYSHSTVTAQSQHSHSTVTAQSQHRHSMRWLWTRDVDTASGKELKIEEAFDENENENENENEKQ